MSGSAKTFGMVSPGFLNHPCKTLQPALLPSTCLVWQQQGLSYRFLAFGMLQQPSKTPESKETVFPQVPGIWYSAVAAHQATRKRKEEEKPLGETSTITKPSKKRTLFKIIIFSLENRWTLWAAQWEQTYSKMATAISQTVMKTE